MKTNHAEIKRLYATGSYSQRQLATQFGLSQKTISNITRETPSPMPKRISPEYNKAYYQAHRQEILNKQRETKKLIDIVAIAYGCQNPGCCWRGSFVASQLTFHHYDPTEKNKDSKSSRRSKCVCNMISSSREKIAAEINKCVVLCQNCHNAFHHSGSVVLNRAIVCKVNPDLSLMDLLGLP